MTETFLYPVIGLLSTIIFGLFWNNYKLHGCFRALEAKVSAFIDEYRNNHNNNDSRH